MKIRGEEKEDVLDGSDNHIAMALNYRAKRVEGKVNSTLEGRRNKIKARKKKLLTVGDGIGDRPRTQDQQRSPKERRGGQQ